MEPRNTEGNPISPGMQASADRKIDTPLPSAVPVPVPAVPAALAVPQEDPTVGSVLDGRYEILCRLGSGGMSVVYKARHKLLDRFVAVKMLHPHLAGSQEILRRFQQEARAVSCLKHPNIMSVFAFGVSEQGQLYLVMDLLEGRNLSEIIGAEGPLDEERSRLIFMQACDALSHSHESGVIHRDLKPSNIVIVNEGGQGDLVKLLDFGIAKIAPVQGRDSQPLTMDGALFGSPPYMSPEQCLGQALDSRSDIYSLGCLMYEVLTGKLPVEGDTPLDTMYKQVNSVPEPFSVVAASVKVSRGMEAIVFRAMEKAPGDRYQSALELRSDLESLASEILPEKAIAGLEASRSKQRRVMRFPRPGRLAAPFSIIAVLLTALILGFSLGRTAIFSLCLPLSVPWLQAQISAAGRDSGEDSPEYVLACARLADTYFEAGKFKESRLLYLKAAKLLLMNAALPAYLHNTELGRSEVRIISRALSDSPQDLIVAMERLGGEFERAGDLFFARRLYREQLSIARQLSDAGLQSAALVHLGDLSLAQGNAGEAESFYKQALQIGEGSATAYNRQILVFLREKLAECYLQEKKLLAAERMLAGALALLPEATPADRTTAAVFHMPRLERCYILEKKEAELERLYRQEIAIFGESLPGQRDNLAAVLHKLADFYYRKNLYAQAEPLYLRQLSLEGTGRNWSKSLGTNQCLADCYLYQAKYDKAGALLRQELDYLKLHKHPLAVPAQFLENKLSACRQPGATKRAR